MTQFSYPRDIYPFQSKWTTINNNRIHYIDEGNGETILFCHPPVMSSFMYRNMIIELSKHFRCIALDFPGYGLSELTLTGDYSHSINAQSEIVAKFIDVLQLQPLYLLMQEVGGHAAMKVFIQHPKKLKGLIITDTIPFSCLSYPKIYRMLKFVNGPIFNFLNINFNFLIRAMTRFGIQRRKLSQTERCVYIQMFNTKQKRKAITHLLYELIEQDGLLVEIQNSLETTFRNLPSLLIYGNKDPLTHLGIPQRLHKILTKSELHLINNEAHFPHEGAPDEMNLIITNWINLQE